MVERLSDKCPCDKCTKDRKCELSQEACEEYLKWEDDCIKKLAEYEIAEEDGRLLVLPCVIGDTVWMVHQELTDAFSIHFTISEMNVVELRGNRMNPIWFVIDGEYGRTSFSPSEIGKTIFLIREEAEKKLKEMKR